MPYGSNWSTIVTGAPMAAAAAAAPVAKYTKSHLVPVVD